MTQIRISFLFYSAFLLFPLLRAVEINDAWLIKFVFLFVISAIFLLIALFRKEIEIIRFKWVFAFSIFVFYSSLRGQFSHTNIYSNLECLKNLSFPVFTLAVYFLFREKKEILLKILNIQSIILITASLFFYFNINYAIRSYWNFGSFNLKFGFSFEDYLFFYNKNFLSIYLFLLSIIIYFYSDKKFISILLLIIAFLCNTGSVKVVFLFTAFIYILRKKGIKINLFYLITVQLIFLLIFTLFSGALNMPSSYRHRIVLWKSSIKMFKDNPLFGVGSGNFIVFIPKYFLEEEKNDNFDISPYAHNDYLEILAENGIIGFILFMISLYILFKESDDNISIILYSFFTLAMFTMTRQMAGAIFLISIALCLEGRDSKIIKLNFFEKTEVFLVFIAFFIGSIMTFFSMYYTNKGYSFLENGKIQAASKAFEKSLKFRKANTPVLISLSDIYFKNKEKEKALLFAEKVYKLEPYRRTNLYNLGNIYASVGDFIKAKKYFNEFSNIQKTGPRSETDFSN